MAFLTGEPPDPAAGYFLLRVKVPREEALLAAVRGALLPLTYVDHWEQFGSLSPSDTVSLLNDPVIGSISGIEFFMIGSIFAYASENPPIGCLPCDGGIYNRVDYPVLYTLLDPVFKIDADTFTVPDLVEKFPLGAGLNPSTSYPVNAAGGAAEVTLTVNQMPSHSHTDAGHTHIDSGHAHSIGTTVSTPSLAPGENPTLTPVPLIPSWTGNASANLQNASADIQSTGGGQAHNNMPPYRALKYAIIAE